MEAVALDLGVGALKFVAESFLQQLRDQKQLIEEVPHAVNQLMRDIEFLHSIESKITSSSNIVTKALLKGVRGEIYQAEDAIDAFVMEEATTRSSICNWLPAGANSNLAEVAKHVQSACNKVNEIRNKVETYANEASTANQSDVAGDLKEPKQFAKHPVKEEEYGPIFEDEEKHLRSRLGEDREKLEVIVINGMHGIGKTTLAAKMFYDKEIRKNFPEPIWVSVSKSRPENIFRSIISQLPNYSQEQVPSDEDLLRQLVADLLRQDQLFIVMDDVQEIDNWKDLESAFEGGNKKSKVLVTTNDNEVTRFVCRRHREPIKLKPLNTAGSWSMLQWRVSRDHGCPEGSERSGEIIAAQCEGLPLVIDFVGDTFSRTDSRRKDLSERRKIWKDLATDITTYFSSDDDQTGPQKTSILSSYNSLSYELRACFLYLGIFPRRSTFSVSKLTRMWIAEGFIRHRGDMSLERIAEMNLKRLIDKNLVIVEDKMPNGLIKTCRMNDLFHNFCKTEAGHEKENFFQEFSQGTTDGAFISKVYQTRRLCIHTQISNFMPIFSSSRPHDIGVYLHSFVTHSDKEVFTLHGKDTSIIRAAFKLLRVLDAKPIKFKKIPADLCQLVYLRFITISLNEAVLPEEISNLRNVQTLIVHTPSRTLEIKANILEMAELRHFKTDASATLPKKSQASGNGERLQTLWGISPNSCTEKFFKRTPNLKKLGIRGKLDPLIDDKNVQLFRKLNTLRTLKIQNDGTSSKFQGKLSSLIQPSRFPQSLRSLTLSDTRLDWEHFSTLGSIENLEELKIKKDAFVGTTWKAKVSSRGFATLETLRIEKLDFVHWESCSSDHFPELRRLDLIDCKKLEKVPIELADIKTFQRLHLANCKASAVASAKKIKAQMKSTRSFMLNLSIFPDDTRI